MKQWQPAPKDMVLELMKTRWSPENPAPEVVVHLWMWHLLESGGTVTVRDLMDYAGWKKWRAHQFQRDALSFRNDWTSHDSGQEVDKKRTSEPVISDTCEPKPDKKRTGSGHSRARAVPSTTYNSTENTITSDKDSVSDLWEEINEARKDALGGNLRALTLTNKRRRFLGARLKKKDGRENVMRVVSWWLHSSHHRATFVRENHGWDTVQRKFDEYLDCSYEEVKPSHDHRKPKREPTMSDLLAERRARRDQLNVVVFPLTPSQGTTNGD
jgi:hypothetical protein